MFSYWNITKFKEMKNWQIVIQKYKDFRNIPSEEYLKIWLRLKCLEEQLTLIDDMKKKIYEFELEYSKTLSELLEVKMLSENLITEK